MSGRRVVITGIGAASPLGLTASRLWQGLCRGSSGITLIKAFDPSGFTCRIAGQVPEYKIQNYIPKSYRKASKLMSRDIELAIIAADEAIKDSGFVTRAVNPENPTLPPERTAINLGAGLISCDLIEMAQSVANSITDGRFDIHKWGAAGIETLSPIWLLKYLPNMLACHIGILHDIQGPSNTITCGESSGLIAIAEASQIIERDAADIALAGSCEAKVNPMVILRQCLLGRTTTEGNDNPAAACRPFDKSAAGCVFSEGAGIIVLEEEQHALRRAAKIYARVLSSGSANSINPAYEHMEPDGKGIEIAISMAIAKAGIKPSDIDLIIPHGTAIPCDDRAEAAAIQNALGKAVSDIPVWPIKGMIGNTGAGAGAIDAIAAIKAIAESKIGPAINFDSPAAGCNLNINRHLVEKQVNIALCCSYSFGGQTSALILKKYNG